MVKIYTQHISKSYKQSKLPKHKCYGYYCNLTKKYNYPRLSYYSFYPRDIMLVEYQYRDERMKNIKSLIY